jgi:hypothetical protein
MRLHEARAILCSPSLPQLQLFFSFHDNPPLSDEEWWTVSKGNTYEPLSQLMVDGQGDGVLACVQTYFEEIENEVKQQAKKTEYYQDFHPRWESGQELDDVRWSLNLS